MRWQRAQGRVRASVVVLAASFLSLVTVLSVPGVPGTGVCAAPAPVKLRLAFWGEAAEGATKNAFYDQVLQRFHARHPEVEIILDMTPSRDYEQELFVQTAAGSPPDVMVVRDMSLQVMVRQGLLLDLTQFINKEKYPLNEFFGEVVNVYRYDGKLYALPPGFTTLVMLYNRDLFEAAALATPKKGWTWDDFAATAQKLTQKPLGPGKFSQYGVFVNEWDGFWTPFVRQNGGDILNAAGTQAVLDSPQNQETFQFLAKLKNQWHVSPSFEEAGAHGWWDGLFLDQVVGMVQLGYWTVGIYKDAKFRWGFAELPQQKRASTLIYSSGYGISSKTKYPELAWELVKELVSADAQRVGLDIPSRAAVAAEVLTQKQKAGNPENLRAFLDSLAYAQPAPQTPNFSEMYRIINGQVWQILTGEKNVQDALNEANVQVNNLLRQTK